MQPLAFIMQYHPMKPHGKRGGEGLQWMRITAVFSVLCAIPACDGGDASEEASEKITCDANKTKFEQTANQYLDSSAGIFKRPGCTLSIDASGAHFRIRPITGGFVIGDPKDRRNMKLQSEFSLSKPCEMIYNFTRHSLMVYTVKSISADAIVISYRLTFDQRSFRKNLVTEDVGTFTLEPFDNP